MTQALQTIEVRARVTGYLSDVFFVDGAEVLQGTPLFEIDPRPFQAELAQAEALVVQAEAKAQRMTLDLNRAEKLIGRGVVSQEDYDKTRGDQKEAEAAVGSARAARDRAKLNLEYTRVRAPISGRVSRRMIDKWNMVKGEETPLTTVVSLDQMYAYFDVDEATALRLRRLSGNSASSSLSLNMPVELGLADEEGFPHKGMVSFVDNQLDGNTGTLRMRGTFPNPEHFLSPGLFVRIRLPLGAPHKALLIPEAAIGRDQGQKYLFVIGNQNKVEYRRVKVGRLYEGLREVTTGLKPDEKVIVNGLQRVRPDIEVEPELAKKTDKIVP
jgi:RND family efflux transporter MFP subunit